MSTIINVWIGIGTTVTGVSTAVLKPRFTDACPVKNVTTTFSDFTTEAFTALLNTTITTKSPPVSATG